jgi:ATP-dependent DNA helicase UvrD/PcrA
VAVSKSIAATTAFTPDERQRAAIEHVHGAMLVVAGAGTGKTTVLTRRIAGLLRDGHARPQEILALTYTENAAREMGDRVRSQLGPAQSQGLRCKTFHAYCNELLVENGRKFGVLDDKDLWIYLRRRIRELKLNYFVRAADVSKFLDDLLDFIRRCHDELAGPGRYADYVRRLEAGEFPIQRVARSKEAKKLSDQEVFGRCHEIANVYSTIEDMLQRENLGTFGHMITRAHELLQGDSELLAKEQQRARFILVDEFQDANFAQVKILQRLAGETRNIFAVGDPDQAIYQFRGASSAAFAIFLQSFPGAKLAVLEKNRRSTTPILRSAFELINHNPEAFGGKKGVLPYRRSPLISAREEEAKELGEPLPSSPVDAVLLAQKVTECSDLVALIQRRKRQLRCTWKDFAVLYRIHSHRDELVEELAENNIPFSIENMDVLDTSEVRDLLACLGAVVSSSDESGMFRVSTLPQFAIDPAKLRAGMKAIPRDATGPGVATVLDQIEGGGAVLETVLQTRDEIARSKAKARDALAIILRRFSLKQCPAVKAVLDFVQAWEKKPLTHTGEIGELVEYLEYFREASGAICMPSSGEDAVQLMTAHTAKGLEWDHVFILRANSGSFPCSFRERLVEFPRELRDPNSALDGDAKALNKEEERRLFYVAMTRARDSLSIYAKEAAGTDPTPAGYLRDLLKNPALQPWLRSRRAQAMQTEIFAEARAPMGNSRTNEWLAMPPARDLGERLSASAVQTYETCPLQFKLQREWNIPGEVPGAMQFGAAVHRVLRAYFDSVRFGREMTEDELLGFFRRELEQAGLQDRYQYELYEKQGEQQIRDFLAAIRRSPIPDVLHVEEWFEVRIGGATVSGRIDRMDRAGQQGVVIIDYKTGKPKSQEDADQSLQLSIYALAAREKWGYRADRLVFYNLEENAPVITVRNDAQLTEARLKVEEVAGKIAAGKFEAKKGFHCNFCNYRNLCPAMEKRVGRA